MEAQLLQFRTENEILKEMLIYAKEKGLQLTDEDIEEIVAGNQTANQYVIDFATHSFIYAQMEQHLERICNDIDINKATGEALDNYGRLLNVARGMAQPSRVDVRFEIASAGEEDIVIPSGTKLILVDLWELRGIVYRTTEEIRINAGVTSAEGVAENDQYGYTQKLPADAVIGVEGFPLITASNENSSTSGNNIEEDDDYRERVKTWILNLEKGTRASFDNYLSNVSGLDSYNIIPRYDGVGTVRVVCDCLPSLLETIRDGVQRNCMLETDYPVDVALPESETIESITLDIVLNNEITTLTTSEIKELLVTQTQTFVSGGFNRRGQTRQGMSIGEDFVASKLVAYLLGQVPEVLGIVPTINATSPDPNIYGEDVNLIYPVGENKKLSITTVNVEVL